MSQSGSDHDGNVRTGFMDYSSNKLRNHAHKLSGIQTSSSGVTSLMLFLKNNLCLIIILILASFHKAFQFS